MMNSELVMYEGTKGAAPRGDGPPLRPPTELSIPFMAISFY
ncbi:hypothetical protein [Telluribacter sp.]|nr:hypothetical protein [Telluribacter sp.]